MAQELSSCFLQPGEETKRLVELFIDRTQIRRLNADPSQTNRAVFRKLHGVAHGVFERAEGLRPEWQQGFLAHEKLDAWVRFSSDSGPDDPDLGSTIGIGIKLFGVPGTNALGEDGNSVDLILQNAERFFVNDAREMVEFTGESLILGNAASFSAKHPITDEVLAEMEAVRGSVLTSTYWALLPFQLGDEIIKYRLWPHAAAENVPDSSANYLATDMAARLLEQAYRFDLQIMVRTEPDAMPLDQATVIWPETADSWHTVATLTLPRQDIGAPGQAAYGQSLSFNIWRTLPQNAPCEASSIAVVRREVYQAGARVRRQAAGAPDQEPLMPRSASTPTSEPDTCIVKAIIHPAIGIARVGSSDEWFHGPEVIDPLPEAPGFYRDASQKLKRQAARFRIYGLNARDEIVRELTGSADASVDWTVTLANTKAAWYGFQLAMDVPEAAFAPQTTLRNIGIADRSRLAITPPPGTVSGPNAASHTFTGKFMEMDVYLGQMHTDQEQRLTVLGGKGVARSHDGSIAITFANNEGWYDDVSDGPVMARVRLGETELPVTPAWIVVAPPNYGPQRKSVRTMWDLMRDVAINAKMLAPPGRPSFTNDILPIFQRMAGLQWVNAGFAAGFGWEGTFDLTSPEVLARLGSTSPAYREQRHIIANSFRDFGRDGPSPVPWPWLYGDAMAVPPAPTPRQHASLADWQMEALDRWAKGDFDADLGQTPAPARSIDEVPVAEQGEMLTRAALEFCLADAFHPGCEMTWPVRAKSMYMAPFRFKHAGPQWIEPAPAAILTNDITTLQKGPLGAQIPGGITRWMAIPWHTDTASCRSGYSRDYDPFVPSFWPARVPNEVLSPQNYAIVMDTTRPLSERQKAFADREAWIEPLGSVGGYTAQINNMIKGFDFLAVVEDMPGPSDGLFPARIEVGDWPQSHAQPQFAETTLAAASRAVRGPAPRKRRSARDVDLSGIDLVNRFPNGLPPQIK